MYIKSQKRILEKEHVSISMTGKCFKNLQNKNKNMRHLGFQKFTQTHHRHNVEPAKREYTCDVVKQCGKYVFIGALKEL